MTNSCIKCGQTKNIEEFVKDNRSKKGYRNLCKECKKIESNKRYKKVKDDPEFHRKKLESNRNYKKTHKEDVQNAWTKYNNRPEVIEKKSNWAREKRYDTVRGRLSLLINSARGRALEKELPFNITINDIIPEEHCPILKIKLKWIGSGPRDTNTPTLDKIIPELGYVKGNVRTISWLANLMKSYATIEQAKTFSENILTYMENKDIVRPMENYESIEL